ncbi:helix-turn-helix transcriptional regulator [Bifidobacterium sp. SO1]|uniref:helix-turn-helix domain-containing protein n=1 Tax=Bifidobacterium sp. SO1 TaxID=2809029 RepID=UPI001BDC328A|nr:helix-turn-helix transcriptional regulator [Bifidobacterium sp. SO1]MBT1161284.1 helix-turn-helix transcriptional regulator [Bifidobacterium sp. SO1]
MANTEETRVLSGFALAFAIEYKAYMKAHGITQVQLADTLGRTQPYVSKGINGKRPLDTDDVDALASLSGTTGRSLMIELARLTREQLHRPAGQYQSVVDQLEHALGRKIQVEKAAYRDPNKEVESGHGEDME